MRALLIGPGACHLPTDLRAWGWVVQLPTTRSRASWGIGDLRDLRQLGEWAASVGAGFVATGPLVAPQPGPDPDPSPYFPSTRRWLDPIHLCIPEVPGADPSDPAAREALALDADPIVDRRRVLALKAEALDRAWRRGAFDHAAFDAWRAAQGAQPGALGRLLPRGRAPRRGLAPLARADAVAARERAAPVRARRSAARCLSRLGAVVPGPAARACRGAGRARRGHARRVRPRRVRCVGLAGAPRAGDVHRRATRSVQRRRSGLGHAGLRPEPAACRRVRSVHRDDPRAAAFRGGAAHRSRPRPLPAVVGARLRRPARGRLRPPADRGAARDRGDRVRRARERS